MTAKPLIRASFFPQKSIKQSIKVRNRLYKDIIKDYKHTAMPNQRKVFQKVSQ